MPSEQDKTSIRNFSIIAHVDHGKSTLADRLLEFTGTIAPDKLRAQFLDQMDLERERGITIKLAPVRMVYTPTSAINPKPYILNLIDTPGHVDFNYEVSRSLACVEGVILLVDATEGIQAQTLANWRLAREAGLQMIPVMNKIDLPNAQIEATRSALAALTGCAAKDVLAVSAKRGDGINELLDAIITRIPPPRVIKSEPVRALIFDSMFDAFRGIVISVRVAQGILRTDSSVVFVGTDTHSKILELGTFSPKRVAKSELVAGEIGYLITNTKNIEECRVGDTITLENTHFRVADYRAVALPGYRDVQPVVFAGIFPEGADDSNKLRMALGKLRLNDAALVYEPEKVSAMGDGFRCGFLGLLHLEITRERLKREYNIATVVTTPNIAYRVTEKRGKVYEARSVTDFPDLTRLEKVEEPWARVELIVPERDLGRVFELITSVRGKPGPVDYLIDGAGTPAGQTVALTIEMPLAGILVDFADRLKAVTTGFGSFRYDIIGWRETEVVRLDILVAEDPVEGLARLVWRDDAERVGRAIVKTLKDIIPPQQFEVKIQAAIGGKVVASERVRPMRKDVIAGLYGGDVSRKNKVLERQRRGKKDMMAKSRVRVPPDAYLAVLAHHLPSGRKE